MHYEPFTTVCVRWNQLSIKTNVVYKKKKTKKQTNINHTFFSIIKYSFHEAGVKL